MNLYELNDKELKNLVRKFNETSYGTLILILSYAISLLLAIVFVSTLLLLLVFWNICSRCIFPIFITDIILLIVSLIFGTRYYVRELRLYINAQGKVKKQSNGLFNLFKRN